MQVCISVAILIARAAGSGHGNGSLNKTRKTISYKASIVPSYLWTSGPRAL